MELFADDENEDSLPKKAFEEGWDGPQPKRQVKDKTKDALNNYIDTLGNDENEVTEDLGLRTFWG